MHLLQKIKSRLSADSLLIKNTSWLLGTEIAARLSRVLTIIVMAAHLNLVEYGAAMLALAFHDIMRLVLKCGAGAQIVQCDNSKLPCFAGNGKVIQWMLCTLLAVTQYHLATVVGHFYDNPDITYLIQCLSPIYLIYPLTSINVFMVMRDNKMRFLSLTNGACILAENFSTILFLLLDFGLISVVLGKATNAGLWSICFALAPVKRFNMTFDIHVTLHLVLTSSKLLGTELSKSIRLHADSFIAGKLLPAELFGIYSFAKTAGIGISQALNNAYNNALFPYLCRLNRENQIQANTKQITVITLVVACAFVAQAALAPYYVPLLFGERWDSAISTVSLLCLAGSMNVLFDTYCNFCRATAQYQHEFVRRLLVSLIGIGCIVLLQPSTPTETGIAVLIGSVIWPLYFAVSTGTANLLSAMPASRQRH